MVEGMSPTITHSLIFNGIMMFILVLQFVVQLMGSVLHAIMFEGVRPTIIFICRIAASTALHSLCVLLFGLAQVTLSLAATGMSKAMFCICMIAVIIALVLLGIFLAFFYVEYDPISRPFIERFVMQRTFIRERRELIEERIQLHLLLLKLFPSVSYSTSQGIGSKFRDCAICLNDFVEGERCWVYPLCKHIFHSSCVGPWLITNLSCPVCRKPVLPV